MTAKVAAIAIGRNEGPRLVRCLASLEGQVSSIIYVDSGSTDGSVVAAQETGAETVLLDMALPFTAARARNAGLARLKEVAPDTQYVQFLDGDCEMEPGWIGAALSAFKTDPELAVVCGRRKERYPEASIWNRLIDAEWDTPVGVTKECGGDALMRVQPLQDVGGYRVDLIAGEEPELCYRLRHAGWRVRRIDAPMTLHDAALTRISQWWKRSLRAGHSFAELNALYGAGPERFRRVQTRRAVLWGAVLPVLIFVAARIFGFEALLLFLIYPAQVLRLRIKGYPWIEAFFLTLGKFPEAQGVLSYWLNRLQGKRKQLIEYK